MPNRKPRETAVRGSRKAGTRRGASSARAAESAVAAFAHDIRTGLTGVLALSELLATADLGERERQWAATVRSTAEHLAALTTLVVDAAKADVSGLVVRQEPFDPLLLAEAVAASLRVRAELKHLVATVAIADDLPREVIGDPVRLRAALENLTDNAVKFTEAGRVGFTVSAEPVGRRGIRLHFSVTDSGIGMTRAELRRLFRPFAQGSPDVASRFGGAGLGLVSVKRLAKAMGGHLTVTSEPELGSTFHLTVRVGKGVSHGVGADEPAVPARSGDASSLKILCAEDNPFARVVLNAMLTSLGHRADYVGTGEAAVQAVATGRYDVVLMDVVLSGLDGIEATRRIRAMPAPLGRIPIVGLSGHDAPATHEACREAGMDAYLVKPISPGVLAEELRRHYAAQAGRTML